jgi:thymidine kinase
LVIQTSRVKQLVNEIPKNWQVPTLAININPINIFEDPSINYDYAHQIRQRLNLLGELLRPKPEEIVKKILKILAASKKSQVIILHSQSMFTGKTTTLCQLADAVGVEKILTFQPLAGLRYPGQDKAVMSRDGHKVNAITVWDNNLQTIVDYVKNKKINSKKISYIFIDELMLFVAHSKKSNQAVQILRYLQKMGFHIIADGIDFTFQEEPFSFMDTILKQTKKLISWHQIEMSTRCRYCDKKARGTRRWKINNKKRIKIADYSDTVFVAGDSEYEPVCCSKHKSCLNQPSSFRRKELL